MHAKSTAEVVHPTHPGRLETTPCTTRVKDNVNYVMY